MSTPSRDKRDAELLHALGHKPAGIEAKESEFFYTQPDGTRIGKFRFHCECGYTSTYTATYKQAVSAGVHHMRKVAKEIRSNGGVSLRHVGNAG